MLKVFYTKSPKETKSLGEKIALALKKKPIGKMAKIFALKGDLGSGKTTFLQGFGKGLKIKEKILSPSFVIIKKFKIPEKNSNFKYFYHMDCYRLGKAEEILNLEFKKIINDPTNIVAIEWPERIKRILPKNSIWVYFEIERKNKRKIKIEDFLRN